jgi:hypothetical protein
LEENNQPNDTSIWGMMVMTRNTSMSTCRSDAFPHPCRTSMQQNVLNGLFRHIHSCEHQIHRLGKHTDRDDASDADSININIKVISEDGGRKV